MTQPKPEPDLIAALVALSNDLGGDSEGTIMQAVARLREAAQPQPSDDVAALIAEANEEAAVLGDDGDLLRRLAAELTRLAADEAAHQEFRLQNDREWRAKLDHAKAEIARLEKERWDQFKRGDAAIARAEKAEAEKERLRKATLEEAAKFIEAHTIMDGSAGQSIVPRKYDGDRFGLAYADGIRALKPDTGE